MMPEWNRATAPTARSGIDGCATRRFGAQGVSILLLLRCNAVRRRLHTPFSLAVLVAAVLAQCGLAASGVVPWLGSRSSMPASMPASASAASRTLTAVDSGSARRLDAAFRRFGYRLDDVANGGAAVPRLVVAAIPADLDRLPAPETRKDVFLRLMLPLVLIADEQVAAERRRLEGLVALKRQGKPLEASQTAWLEGLAVRYEVPPGPRQLAELLKRVDVVPPSLALAQAALETGWGTSHLARRGNNLFGQNLEDGGEVVGQARFGTLLDAVRSYVHNLDTHRAYRAFRRARAQARGQGGRPEGLALARTLTAYSELGRDYVDDVRAVIRANALDRFDGARLDDRSGGQPSRGI